MEAVFCWGSEQERTESLGRVTVGKRSGQERERVTESLPEDLKSEDKDDEKQREKLRTSQAAHLCMKSCVFCLELKERVRGRG